VLGELLGGWATSVSTAGSCATSAVPPRVGLVSALRVPATAASARSAPACTPTSASRGIAVSASVPAMFANSVM
jgi:hypothetical protein